MGFRPATCSHRCKRELTPLRETDGITYYRCDHCGHRVSTCRNPSYWSSHGDTPWPFEDDDGDFDFGLDDFDFGF